jgi:type VII secretion-associated serine protease mycosin
MGCAVGVILGTLLFPDPARGDTRGDQWYLDQLQIGSAQAITKGTDVVVAVVDTGVDRNQPELSGVLVPGADAAASFGPGDQVDEEGHGTAMATLIAGRGRGTAGREGILGIAPAAKILPVKANDVVDWNAAEAEGVGWAAEHGAKVICVAYVGNKSTKWTAALAKARAADALVIAATGNRDADHREIGSPAELPGVLAVGATTRTGRLAGFSLTGAETSLTAPGTNIPVPAKDGGYVISQGTSASTAIVAGIAALVRAKYPNLSAAEVAHRLEATADDQGPPGRDDQYGYGIVNPLKALTADVPPLGASPSSTSKNQSTGHHDRKIIIGTALLALSALVGAAIIVIAALRWRRGQPG